MPRGRPEIRIRRAWPAALALGLLLSVVGAGESQDGAEEAYRRALAHLAEARPSEAKAQARTALSLSARFAPEKEMESAPEKGLLFDDAFAQARERYRARRARYYLVLGKALSAEGNARAARRALERSLGLGASAEAYEALLSLPALGRADRIALLLNAFFEPRASRPGLARQLLDTGAFRGRGDLQAVIDQERFRREYQAKLGAVEARVGPPAPFRVTTDAGVLVESEALRAGGLLVTYFPGPGCERCGEELEGIGLALSKERKKGREVTALALVNEEDLGAVRRMVRLLALSVPAGRADRLPPGVRPSVPAIEIAARGGYARFRLPLLPVHRGVEIERSLEALFDILRMDDVPGELNGAGRALEAIAGRSGERGILLAYLDVARALEAGPLGLGDVSDRLDRSLGLALQNPLNRKEVRELLGRFSDLAGAGRAKARILEALDGSVDRKLLAAARSVRASIVKEAGREEGAYRVALDPSSEGPILLQRSFLDPEPVQIDFVLEDRGREGLEVSWVGEGRGAPRGARLAESGAVFFFETEGGLQGLRLVGRQAVVFEGVPASLEGNTILEAAPALVDPVPGGGGPFFVRRLVVASDRLLLEESSLAAGLGAFSEARYQDALAAFQKASKEIDPEAGYEETDVRYNIARCHEAKGERAKAIEVLLSIGDASYQSMVDERARALETAPRW